MAYTIDLHLHSTASDGSDTIPELLQKIRTSDLHTFAITDHDTMDGVLEMDTLNTSGLRYIRGIEFSCVTSFKKCHILGYGIDSNHPVFQKALQLVVNLRQEKLHRRVNYFKSEYGIELTEEESKWLYSQKSPGKPHFGQLILNRGLASDMRTAIKNYVNPCKVGKDRIDSSIAIDAILRSGGIPVWAHPLGGELEKRLTKEEFQTQLEELITNGIQGLECYYSRYNMEEIHFLIEQAQKYNLFISGGSDYHGDNKPDLHLGKMNLDSLEVEPEKLTILKKAAYNK